MVLLALFLFLGSPFSKTEEKWKGFDEVVIGKIAEEKGREPKGLFQLEGDSELFVFTILSGIAGFIVGYYWRKLLSENKDASYSEKRNFFSSTGS
ncbi:MAG: hypothetical protein N2327_06245 [Caldimicrobium sp.]|nr:hypothetical protein [Caldimicrobium sp.]MCX7874012.1 hypothetical protein [Caldimicrobium sp.]MDW8094160.1 hypothetical protein [Caldimicrobium sp.]